MHSDLSDQILSYDNLKEEGVIIKFNTTNIMYYPEYIFSYYLEY